MLTNTTTSKHNPQQVIMVAKTKTRDRSVSESEKPGRALSPPRASRPVPAAPVAVCVDGVRVGIVFWGMRNGRV